MMSACRALVLAVLFIFASIVVSWSAPGMAINPEDCLGCHGERIDADKFAASVHGKDACTSCHVEMADLAAHMRRQLPPTKVNCARCHAKVASEHYASVHMLRDIACSTCHKEIHAIMPWKKDKRVAVRKCLSCHKGEALYNGSVHGKGVEAGNIDAAACHDCHGLHEIRDIGEPGTFRNREFHTLVCLKCHADRQMMERNGVFTLAVATYEQSYHGKNYRLGYPERVAGCVDCHTSHNVLPASDPNSSVHSGNVVKTCSLCHSNAGPRFAGFLPHAEPHDRERYPVLFWTYMGMTSLLASVFIVFWLHTLFWMVRGFVENRGKRRLLEAGVEHVTIERPHKPYYRFRPRHIALHLMVVTSFLGLSLTGLPMKFNDQQWARTLMNLFGGTATAGLVHRFCAVITFAYFLIAIGMSIHFLFFRKDLKGNWIQRLFGPESLCPNLRDVRDVAGMMRWFMFRGPKPTFDRWTYWEKFDFLAVFWGMFAIGGSGLILWFPEFFANLFPGWIFNVATIIHSDEALLATGFIFTVHFFNTHGRPEKYPMDFVIFNGRISKQEFIEERGDQWKRYQENGVLSQYDVQRPSNAFYEFTMMLVALAALFTGLLLLSLMIYAYLQTGFH